MRSFLSLLLILFFSTSLYSQTEVRGVIADANTGELLIGATIVYGKGKGVSSDLDGNYSFYIQPGERNFRVSYVGYKEINRKINIQQQSTPLILDFKLETKVLSEVQVVADIAIDRETPVAFSTIPIKKINEELASQDIPMILNSTPGVYATQQGGGDGDARITIRGFSQRNIAVMIDGIPVNDMENGKVYWSNWFGLDAVTSNIQVQRGLGASKIAIPSVGGTMNILTKGTGNNKGGMVKQEVGSFGKLRTSFGYNTGKTKKGWGLTLAGSYKQGDGFADQNWSKGYFYYAKIQKEIGNHIISLSAMGAPQKHGQRYYKSDIATYDTSLARDLGDNSSFDTIIEGEQRIVNKGITYNKFWGYLDRWEIDANGKTVHANEILNTRQNYYHKPRFALRDFWKVNDKLHISNIIYASIGNGGGTYLYGEDYEYDSTGQINLQKIYNNNSEYINRLGGIHIGNTVESSYQSSMGNKESMSGTYLRSSVNNHHWYGMLSTTNYQINNRFNLSGGVDLRYYKGEHYGQIYDLLGGDFVADGHSNKTGSTLLLREGDRTGYHNDGMVKWAGVFSQLEYTDNKLSFFFNISGSNTAYKRVDYFKKKDLVLDDITYKEVLGTSVLTEYYDINWIRISEEDVLSGAVEPDSSHKMLLMDTIWHNGKAYTMNSKEAEYASTDWKWIRGYTIKTGANYNLDDFNNVFCNLGYISKAPKFKNVYERDSGEELVNIENEEVNAIELGYSYRSTKFSANVNTYYTKWKNKPSQSFVEYTDPLDEIKYISNINGMDALHKGIEIDFVYKYNHQFTIEGLLSLGDWQYTSTETVRFYDQNNEPLYHPNGDPVEWDFDAEGLHVGDAAQTQVGFSTRYTPIKDGYIKLRGTYFTNYYSDFNPIESSVETWKIPPYYLMDLHCGYKLNLSERHKISLRLSVLNLLNKMYISDATDNDPYNAYFTDSDAKSAGVYFGSGRRINFSTSLMF
ncbi:MAG: TonB-dependent receptor [Bacteroidota bacterium]|nr:TonB-dependent receptor [Bacteroidota bacterium]